LWIFLAVALTAISNLHAQQPGSVSWGPSQSYDVGYNPSVATYGSELIEVHNGQNGAGAMWYHVGQASFAWPSSSVEPPPPVISWGPFQQ
jgi:hypothetical protein